MAGGKPETNVPDLPQGRGTLGNRAAIDGAGKAGSQLPTGPDPVAHQAGSQIPMDEATGKPDAAPVEAKPFRIGKLPSWASLPRDVVICLAAVIAAGLIILLVLSAQWPRPG